ncbi:MAG TPA: L-rhamnose isomerase [Candidatus Latescibacteria bacterium]|nr:L-rhamnose isomerase [Gemmatimonadota bacterium]HCR17688.1 L-rhamnose isomerase [Candidatus Latescibacterota bacterium]
MDREYDLLAERLDRRGLDIKEIKAKLKVQEIETPSWGYGNSGTRFGVFKQAGAARDLHERLQDAAMVHKLTGVCPSVAVHIPWDKVDDYEALIQEASDLGIRIGAVNPNVFQDDAYKMGSFANSDAKIRGMALEHMYDCIDIMKKVNSKILSLWFADGTNYPGQGDFRRRKHWFEECLREVHKALPEDARMLVEYKFFEPGFYLTDIADWGMAAFYCRNVGPKAQALVDLGHHPLSTNIEHVVAFLIDEGLLGGFHFNNRKYADDDVTTGSTNPYEVFLIYNEIVGAEQDPAITDLDIAFMVDQSHNIKPKMEAMIQTVVFIQSAYARSLLVDREALLDSQDREDTVGSESILQDAYNTDVRPLLSRVRQEMGRDPRPMDAYRKSRYFEQISKARVGELEGAASWG